MSGSMPCVKISWLNMASGLGVTILSIWSSIASGRRGVGVIVGVSVTEGVNVIVGDSVMVGVIVIVGVSVMVGVREGVGVGGKKLYATGSANRFTSKAVMPMMIPKAINRQPRTMRSRLMRKNLKLRALRIDRMPNQMLSTNPITARMMATWTAA